MKNGKFIKSVQVTKILCMCTLLFPAIGFAQRAEDDFYKKIVVRAIDMREKQNEGMFSRNREITRWIVDAVKRGELTAYENDSLEKRLSVLDFKEKLLIPSAGLIIDASNPKDTLEAYLQFGEDWRLYILEPEEYLARDLYQIEIVEEVVFNKNRSLLERRIKTLSVYIPADHPLNVKGIQLPVASFLYDDIKEKVFNGNSKAIWYNSQNEAGHIGLAEAFELRLFSSYIIKVGNAKDLYLADVYGDPKTGIMASQWAANELMEYEHNLWEY